tara:strand:+ start:617 stop:1780 length:1164 start_codon:yes stop_codon:yes gene_type:complete
MIEKVIFIGYVILNEKLKEDFFFYELNKKKVKTEYWNFSKIYFKKSNFSNQNIEKCINSFNEFGLMLKQLNLKKTTFVLTMSYNFRTIYLYYLLKKYKCKIVFFSRGVLPSINYNSKHIFQKLKYLKNYKYYFLQILKTNFSLFLKKIGLVKTYDIILHAGDRSLNGFCVGYKIDLSKAKIFKLNYFDFDKSIKIKYSKKIIKNKYCVFHDEYLPFHPDFELQKKDTVEPNVYYINLNKFFTHLEKKFNIEVVIAAHPKAIDYKRSNPFERRKLFFGKTAELSKYSEFSLIHVSSSVSFPVIYKKPIIFLTSNQIINKMFSYSRWISNFSDELGSKLINYNNYNDSDLDQFLLNTTLYEKYISNYLASNNSCSTLSSKVFLESLSIK